MSKSTFYVLWLISSVISTFLMLFLVPILQNHFNFGFEIDKPLRLAITLTLLFLNGLVALVFTSLRDRAKGVG